MKLLVLGGPKFLGRAVAYADFSLPMDEKSALAALGDDPIEELTSDFSNYGALKALREAAVSDVFGERSLLDEAQPTEAAGLSPEREAALLAEWHAR